MTTVSKAPPRRYRRSRSAATRGRIRRVRRARGWARAPLAGVRREVALRRELVGEVAGLFRDIGGTAVSPVRRRRAEKRQLGTPATKREAEAHARFKQHRPRRQAPSPVTATPGTPRSARPTNPIVRREGRSAVSDVVQQLVRAANQLGEVDIVHADEFDEITTAMSKAMEKVGDSFTQFADTCDELKMAPKVTRHLHEAAKDVADLGEHYKTARRVFRDEYDEYLNPPDRMPDPEFFQHATS